ncbi:MAG: tRNA (adenosine(37)-N6)-dimethylallyltransferase MiaA [Thermodesulfobacteriota bacterium]
MTTSTPRAPLIILVGPTAIGKTELSLTLAEMFGGEIISMDSMQIYRHMDIGTAKPSRAERQRVVHHLIDYVDPDEPYHVARYTRDAEEAIAGVRCRGRLPMLVGGTGLYMKGLLEGIFAMPEVPEEIRQLVQDELQKEGAEKLHRRLQSIDPESAARIHPHDPQRLVRAMEVWLVTGAPWSTHLNRQQQEKARQSGQNRTVRIGLTMERQELYTRINHRVGLMVSQGLLEEVEKLLAMGFPRELNPMQSIGYRHMINFIDRLWSWEKTLELLARDTRRYAKRQLTWFGRDSAINWFRPDETNKIINFIRQALAC